MKTAFAPRTPFVVMMHALGTIGGSVATALVLSLLGGWLGSLSDPTGWMQLAWSAVGGIVGLPLGVFFFTWGLGRALRVAGSWGGALLGTVIGAALLAFSIRLGIVLESMTLFAGVGVLVCTACALLGYYQPWKARRTR
jgi:hypothetical protein